MRNDNLAQETVEFLLACSQNPLAIAQGDVQEAAGHELSASQFSVATRNLATLHQYREDVGLRKEWTLNCDESYLPESLRQFIGQHGTPFLYIAHWPVPREYLEGSVFVQVPTERIASSIETHFDNLFCTNERWAWHLYPASNRTVMNTFAQTLEFLAPAIEILLREHVTLDISSNALRLRTDDRSSAVLVLREDEEERLLVAQRRSGGTYRFDFFECGNVEQTEFDDAVAAFLRSAGTRIAWRKTLLMNE